MEFINAYHIWLDINCYQQNRQRPLPTIYSLARLSVCVCVHVIGLHDLHSILSIAKEGAGTSLLKERKGMATFFKHLKD